MEIIDLNEVRLHALVGGARHVADRLSEHAHAPVDWLDGHDRVRWAFALGQGYYAIESALTQASALVGALRSDETYRLLHEALVEVVRDCRAAVDRTPAESVALGIVADELAPVIEAADRAPGWLRERMGALGRA